MKWNKLDERELMIMLKARHCAFGAVFLILAISLLVKCYFLQLPLGYFATEAIALIVGGVIECVMESRRGLFDPDFRPAGKNYFFLSLGSAVVFTAVFAAGRWYREPMFRERPLDLALAAVIMFISLFVLIFAALALYGSYAKYRQKKLEENYEEDEEDGEK